MACQVCRKAMVFLVGNVGHIPHERQKETAMEQLQKRGEHT